MRKVVISADLGYPEWLTISCPYEPHFVKALKREVDSAYRWWDKDSKLWHIRSAFIKEVLPLCRQYYEEVECRVNVKEVLASSKVNVFEQLFKRITPQYADRIYKSLAKVVHPDLGGDADLMKQLNEAYQMVPLHGADMVKRRK